MLTKKEKLVLNYLIEQYYNGNDGNIEHCVEIQGITDNELPLIFKSLSDNGYIKLTNYIDGSYRISVNYKGLAYKEIEQKFATNSSPIINNYGNINNSAVGNVGSTTINNGLTFDDAFKLINSTELNNEEKELSIKIIEYLQILIENEAPIKKGFLSKFSDFMSTHSWFLDIISKLITTYYIN